MQQEQEEEQPRRELRKGDKLGKQGGSGIMTRKRRLPRCDFFASFRHPPSGPQVFFDGSCFLEPGGGWDSPANQMLSSTFTYNARWPSARTACSSMRWSYQEGAGEQMRSGFPFFFSCFLSRKRVSMSCFFLVLKVGLVFTQSAQSLSDFVLLCC